MPSFQSEPTGCVHMKDGQGLLKMPSTDRADRLIVWTKVSVKTLHVFSGETSNSRLRGKPPSRWPSLLRPTLAVVPPRKHPPLMIGYLYPLTPSVPDLPIPWCGGILIALILMVHFPFCGDGAASRPSPPHTLSEGRVNTVSQPALHPHLPSHIC